jgi:hypothetical protein
MSFWREPARLNLDQQGNLEIADQGASLTRGAAPGVKKLLLDAVGLLDVDVDDLAVIRDSFRKAMDPNRRYIILI